jgi:diaminopimelate decarboxylase
VEANVEFTRVVIEIPALHRFPLPPLPENAVDSFYSTLSKHPSGMPALSERLRVEEILSTQLGDIKATVNEESSKILGLILESINSCDFSQVETPFPLPLDTVTETLFRQTREAVEVNSFGTQVAVAYSVKTNPDVRHLELAHKHGFLAEVISQFELRKVLSAGFDPEQIVMNGPGKWWPSVASRGLQLHAIFCDSLEELEWLICQYNKGVCVSRFLGFRLRPPQFPSRFGIQVGEAKIFRKLISLLRQIPADCPVGIHFHFPSSSIGIEGWLQLYESILAWGKAVEAASGVKVRCVDLGGGWFPDDWFDLLLPQLDSIINKAVRSLPSLERVILEPGRAVTQCGMVLLTRVLDVRRSDSVVKEVVVDASIAEIPTAQEYPHRILRLTPDGKWEILRRGKGILLGRLCMEDDIIASGIEFPDKIQSGEILVICDVGAYDRSMSYAFGRG